MTESTRIALVGATGRMGGEVLANSADDNELEIVSATSGSDNVGVIVGPTELEVTEDVSSGAADADVVIDFSTPDGFDKAIAAAVEHGIPLVSGTTGLSDPQLDTLDEASEQIPVLLAANFSVGVNALERLVELASKASGEDFDIEVFEAHHNRKVDAPSGTALFLGEAAARGRDLELDEHATWGRHGHTGERHSDEIGFQVLRGGDIVGEHTVYFCGPGERIELTHRAQDRGIFARGALRAARWITGREPGRYSMTDVLFGRAFRP